MPERRGMPSPGFFTAVQRYPSRQPPLASAPRLSPPRRKVLHDLKLDLLNLGEPFPLAGDQVIDLFMQMADFQLGLEVDAVVVLRTKAVLRLLPLLAHHDDRRLERR